jgi:hypothetical protein
MNHAYTGTVTDTCGTARFEHVIDGGTIVCEKTDGGRTSHAR